MKKIILATVIFVAVVFISYNSFGSPGCGIGCYIGTTPVIPNLDGHFVVDTTMNPGDTLSVRFSAWHACLCHLYVQWCHQGTGHDSLNDAIFASAGFNIVDTGIYYIVYNSTNSPYCGGDGLIVYDTINVTYAAPSYISSISNPALLQIYPTLSHRHLQNKNDGQHHIKKITVSDEAGRIIYSSSTDFSEINLSRFAEGIYFYAVEDEMQKVYRGKLMKN